MTKRDVYTWPRGGKYPKGVGPSPRKLHKPCPSCGELALKVEPIPSRLEHAIVTCSRCKLQRSIRYSPVETEDDILRKLAGSWK